MKLPPSTPLWLAAHNLLMAQGDDFFRHLRKTEQHLEVEEIHDLRVASRRLREALALFSRCFAEGEFSRFEKKVKKVTRLLGALRNSDEAISFFGGLSEEGEAEQRALRELLQDLQAERDREGKEVKRRLRTLSVGKLEGEFEASCHRPVIFDKRLQDPFMPIADYAREAVRQRTLDAAQLLPHALREDASEAQHRLRIAVKHLRYRIEIVSPLVASGYDDLHATLKGYQDVLGKLHDLDVFRGMVTERLADGSDQQRVLDALAEKRERLFASFAENASSSPVESVGERAAAAMNG